MKKLSFLIFESYDLKKNIKKSGGPCASFVESHKNARLHKMTCVISNRGTWTWRECNGDKKHSCFHWELDYDLNFGLKQK